MSHFRDYYKSLPKSKQVQFTVAAASTVLLLTALPVVAWFSYQRGIVKLQKIQSPNTLVLSAAHREDCVNFEINGINADENMLDGNNDPITENNKPKKITHKDYVFAVSGTAVDKFTIQLAYTTNNPFTYEVYAADEVTEDKLPTPVAGQEKNYVAYVVKADPAAGVPVLDGAEYHLDAEEDDILYYLIDSDCSGTTDGKYTGTYLNRVFDASDHENANSLYHTDTYEKSAAYANVHPDAEPVYWQATNVEAFPGKTNSNKDPFSRHFILRVKWKDGDLDNTTKETDIVYITVKATN